jgi:two-component system, NtrC family, response regulator AtoC
MRSVRQAESTPQFEGMIASSEQMRALFKQIERVAPYEASVLIRGETGTGKELVAKALHRLSSRSRGPFRAINCATLTPELLASELFGHVKGAFTGAIKDRKGLFELANNGTLFLDEIAELPLELQARLLRVIQEQQFIPVGATEPVRVNVRILSATHRALRSEVEAGRFRGDLMYRLRVIPIYLPPLRERGDDLLLITRALIQEFNADAHAYPERPCPRQVGGLSTEAELALKRYHWPGNIRELRNSIEYALIMGDGDLIDFNHLPPELRGESPTPELSPSLEVKQMVQSAERGAILKALNEEGGHRERAAKRLGMSRATLWRKMRDLALLKPHELSEG